MPPPAAELKGDLNDIRRQINDAYRLRPDKRFLLAVADIHATLTGKARQEAEASWRNDAWWVNYRGETLGSLSQMPDFPELLEHLRSWAQTTAQRAGFKLTTDGTEDCELHEALKGLYPRHLLTATVRANVSWRKGQRSPALLASSAQALVWLALQMLDETETADVVSARALAVLALAQALTKQPLVGEEALLADAMGYSAHGGRLVATLANHDPVRLFIERDDSALESVAKAGTAEARLLYLLRLGEHKETSDWLPWSRTYMGDDRAAQLPVLKAAVESNDFDTAVTAGQAAVAAAIEDLHECAGHRLFGWLPTILAEVKGFLVRHLKPGARSGRGPLDHAAEEPLQGVIPRLEHALEGASPTAEGPFMDREILRAFYRACAYSGIYGIGHFYLEMLSSVDASTEFAASLGPKEPERQSDLQRWLVHMAAAKAGERRDRALVDDLFTVQSVGEPLLYLTLERAKAQIEYGSPRLFQATRAFVAHLDTRPEHRWKLGVVAHDELLDLPLAETAFLAWRAATGSRKPWGLVWLANFEADGAELRRLLHDPRLEPKHRVEALGFLEALGAMSGPELDREYERAVADGEADWWTVVWPYVKYLERTNRCDLAQKVSETWLAHHDQEGGFPSIRARTALAEIHLWQGRCPDGLDIIGPAAESWQNAALRTNALLLDCAGRRDEAEQVARAASDRYPDSIESFTLMVELMWRHGKYQEAAATIKNRHNAISVTDWRWQLGPAFASTFRANQAAGMNAAGALIAAVRDPVPLGSFALGIDDAGAPELAAVLAQQLRASGIHDEELATAAYRFLTRAGHEDEALAWLRARIQGNDPNALCIFAWEHNEHSLLWDAIAEQPTGKGAEWVWVMRAAAAARDGIKDDPHREALLRHFSSPATSEETALGRVLLGLAPEKEAIAYARDQRSKAEIAFYLGVKAEGEGRFREASAWYRVAAELGPMSLFEYRAAFDQLYVWFSRARCLECAVHDKGKPLTRPGCGYSAATADRQRR